MPSKAQIKISILAITLSAGAAAANPEALALAQNQSYDPVAEAISSGISAEEHDLIFDKGISEAETKSTR